MMANRLLTYEEFCTSASEIFRVACAEAGVTEAEFCEGLRKELIEAFASDEDWDA